MGAAEPIGSELTDSTGSVVRDGKIFAANSGVCVEDNYPKGAVLLHLGSGACRWDGWVNVDLNQKHADLVADIRDLPCPDNHADVIVAIHVVEHIYRWEVDAMLANWLRVLKPGGKVIIEVPSMDKVFMYISRMIEARSLMSPAFSWFPLWGDPKYRDEAMVHRWGYTSQMLREILVKSGFVNVNVETPRYHFPNRDMRVTAVKPNSIT